MHSQTIILVNMNDTHRYSQIFTDIHRYSQILTDMLTEQEIYSVVSFLSKQGATADKLLYTLSHLKNGNGELSPEISTKIANIINGINKYEKNITSEVENLILNSKGQFTVSQIYNDINAFRKQDKDTIRYAIGRLVKKGIIEKYGDKSGTYRRVDKDWEEMDWFNATTKELFINFP